MLTMLCSVFQHDTSAPGAAREVQAQVRSFGMTRRFPIASLLPALVLADAGNAAAGGSVGARGT